MFLCLGESLGLEDLYQMLGIIAHGLERAVLLGVWHMGASRSYVIAAENAGVARMPAFQPLAKATPDGVIASIADPSSAS